MNRIWNCTHICILVCSMLIRSQHTSGNLHWHFRVDKQHSSLLIFSNQGPVAGGLMGKVKQQSALASWLWTDRFSRCVWDLGRAIYSVNPHWPPSSVPLGKCQSVRKVSSRGREISGHQMASLDSLFNFCALWEAHEPWIEGVRLAERVWETLPGLSKANLGNLEQDSLGQIRQHQSGAVRLLCLFTETFVSLRFWGQNVLWNNIKNCEKHWNTLNPAGLPY